MTMASTVGGSVQLPEDQLVARCRAGDLDAFGAIYAQYERQIFRHAYFLLGHRDDADDVKQETFLKAYNAMPNFRGQCSMLTWLMKICGNLCRDRIKARLRHKEVLYDPQTAQEFFGADTHSVDPRYVVERADTTEIILRVLSALPEPQRNLIVLHEVEGLSCKQIAEILECSATSVKLRLFRARRLFKDRVESMLNLRG